MLQARNDPKLLNDPEFVKKSLQYYEGNTDLTRQSFWIKMDEDTRFKTLQSLILQEVLEPQQVRMTATIDKAAVYIVLSGTVEITTDPTQEGILLGPGSVFGAVELFNRVQENIEYYRNMDTSEVIHDGVLTAKVKQGAFVRLSLDDYINRVHGIDYEEEARKTRAEDSKIAEIPWEDLTDDDKFYIRVYKRTREIVNRHLFAFLDAYRMIPKNARTQSYKYFSEVEIFREIILNPNDPPCIYIIIDGSIRVELETKRGKDKAHTVTCKRKNRKPMVLKVS